MQREKQSNHRQMLQNYSEAFKRKVCEEYLATGVSKTYLLQKYGIKFRSGIQHWMRLYGYVDIYQKHRSLFLPKIPSLAAKKIKKETPDTNQQLEARIKELERLLEDEQLRSEAYQRMIDIAEKELNIPIRKKPNTK